MDLNRLKEPFPVNEINWRVGATNKDKTKGIALAYIDSRAVMDRLDEVVGTENWQDKYSFGKQGEVICSIGINIDGEWVYKSDGAGQTQFEAEKGGLSDAFKRCGVKWGVGRYLYHLPANWVPIKKAGKSFKIINPPDLPDWALPADDLSKIRNYYTQNKEIVEPILIDYLNKAGFDDLKYISKLNESQSKKLLKDIQKAV